MRVETYSHPGRHVAPSASDDLPIRARREGKDREADVCLIVEGAYPHVSGGVSTWVHGLIRRRPDLRFCVVAILPEPPAPVAKYAALPNLDALHHLYLSESARQMAAGAGRGHSTRSSSTRRSMYFSAPAAWPS